MELELFAQINSDSDAYKAGQVVGIVIAVLLSASIPIAFGASRGQAVLGVVGAVCAIPAAFFLGCLGGLPVALLFVGIIALVSSGGGTRKKRKKKPRRVDDEEDDYDRPRRSRRRADEEDDRPRRSRRDDDDEEDEDDRPRRRRRSDD